MGRRRGSAPTDDPVYVREFEHLTLVRILLARRYDGALEDAIGLLDRLLVAADGGGRAGSVVEILVLAAVAHHAAGDAAGAADVLDDALAPAEPEGYVRVFLDEAPTLTPMVRAVGSRGRIRAARPPGARPPLLFFR